MFNLAFPLVGFSTVVVAWRLLARFDQCAYCYWAVVAVLGNGFNLLSTLPYYGCQLTAALVFGLVRTLQWAAYFHFLGAPPRPPLGPPLTNFPLMEASTTQSRIYRGSPPSARTPYPTAHIYT